MIEIDAVDLFVEKDPEKDDDDAEQSLISLRVPADREFGRQLKELGAKWDDASKEWRLVGNEATVKQIGALCKVAFPKLPRRRNRLVAAQIDTAPPKVVEKKSAEEEIVVRVEFLVNRTIKNYRRGQNLKWAKEFRQSVEPNADASAKPAEENEAHRQYANQLQGQIRELEQTAAEAFEALLVGRKEAVSQILKEAGIAQG